MGLVVLLAAYSGCNNLPGTEDAGTEDAGKADAIGPPPTDQACLSCVQSDPASCGWVSSYCSCFPGPACCCKGSG